MTRAITSNFPVPRDMGWVAVAWRYGRAAGRTALQRSLMMTWIITPLLPGIAAVLSWCLGI